jgi:hypothetical protein
MAPEYAVCHDEPHHDDAQIKERLIRQSTVLDKVFWPGVGSGWLLHLKHVVIGRSLGPNQNPSPEYFISSYRLMLSRGEDLRESVFLLSKLRHGQQHWIGRRFRGRTLC